MAERRVVVDPDGRIVAREQPERYEIQFWGEMVLSRGEMVLRRDPRREFDLLCDHGYPVVLRDVAMSIGQSPHGLVRRVRLMQTVHGSKWRRWWSRSTLP